VRTLISVSLLERLIAQRRRPVELEHAQRDRVAREVLADRKRPVAHRLAFAKRAHDRAAVEGVHEGIIGYAVTRRCHPER